MQNKMLEANEVLNFWFKELNPKQWFEVSSDLDRTIEKRFLKLHTRAAACELSDWRQDALGRLAEILVLDQFSRNIFRGEPRAFSQDPLALALSQEAIRARAHEECSPVQKSFLYLPFMHSESRVIHETAVHLYSEPGLEMNLDFELRHKAIIDRFGRYPHRNQILGRESTAEEIEFLNQPGSSF